MRLIFSILLLLHGLIHLMGFAKAFNYAEISQLTKPITKPAGVFWGLAALLFTTTAVLFFIKNENWWKVGGAAIVISQTLIFQSWQDAKFGTLANLIIGIGAVIGYAQWDFGKMAKDEVDMLLSHPQMEKAVVTEASIASLPPIVQTWLRHSKVVEKPAVSTIHLWQKGEMRTTPDGKWMPVEAEQYFNINPPAFIWLADVKMMPSLRLAGRDKYMDGRGHMLIKALSLVPVADAKGPETDQGSLLRFLAEMVWFPSAALSDYITWEQIDTTSAKATMAYRGVTASGIFYFKENGDFHSFEADRYYDRGGLASLERWHIEAKEWKELNGVRVPIVCEVTWKLEEGDFTWFKLEILDVVYD